MRVSRELFAFGMVGTVGFVVNTGVVYLIRGLIGVYPGGVLAWLVAATATWWLNRVWTFQSAESASALAQWLRFLMANVAGFALYFLTYASLVMFSSLCARAPIIAIAAGAGVSMAVNFILSRELVFSGSSPMRVRARPSPPATFTTGAAGIDAVTPDVIENLNL